jgi:hypothetical protein
MRLSFLLPLLLTGLTLLAACTKEPRPVRLDFIGSSRFTAGNRRASPGDTLSVRLYASGSDDSVTLPLRHFTAQVTYDPGPQPVVYSTTGTAPSLPNGVSLVYLDSTLLAANATRELVYQTTFGTRTTSGVERWEFTVSDGTNSATRRFQVRVNNGDSLALFHQYTLRIPSAPARPPRPFVALLPGLALPASALRSGPTGRALIDLVYRPGATALELYQNNSAPRAQLRLTGLDSTTFARIATIGQITEVVGPALPSSPVTSTGPLQLNQVFAFRTIDNHAGVFTVRRLAQTPYPVLELLVKVLKTPG